MAGLLRPHGACVPLFLPRYPTPTLRDSVIVQVATRVTRVVHRAARIDGAKGPEGSSEVGGNRTQQVAGSSAASERAERGSTTARGKSPSKTPDEPPEKPLTSSGGAGNARGSTGGGDAGREGRGKKGKARIDPVGIVASDPSLKAFEGDLRARYKRLKDLRQLIEQEDEDLLELANAHKMMGLHRHPWHCIELYEWAPGATGCALVGTFNDWDGTEAVSERGPAGCDELGVHRVVLQDRLRAGQQADPFGQEYNYDVETDSGDRDLDWEGLYRAAQEGYWEEGEDHLMHEYVDPDLEEEEAEAEWGGGSVVEGEDGGLEEGEEGGLRGGLGGGGGGGGGGEGGGERSKQHVQGKEWVEKARETGAYKGWVNGPMHLTEAQQREEEQEDGQTEGQAAQKPARRQQAKASGAGSSKSGNSSKLPPIAVPYTGSEGAGVGDWQLLKDPAWAAYVENKQLPYPYWLAERKGRKAWARKYEVAVRHGDRWRVQLSTAQGLLQRVSAWATFVAPEDREGRRWSGVVWDPPLGERHKWQHTAPPRPRTLRVYEAHVGSSGGKAGRVRSAGEEERGVLRGEGEGEEGRVEGGEGERVEWRGGSREVTSFDEFTDAVLPRIKAAGYNAVLLLGIMEHPDYASLGLKVSSPFAVSSRFGSPDAFKRLVDTAHGMGLLVMMSVVLSQVGSYEAFGLLNFDGQANSFIRPGKRGYHKRVGTRIPDFGSYEVKRYLLSNLRWWAEEYQLDGMLFHSLPSMIYYHNGYSDFERGVEEFFGAAVDEDALAYLVLANDMLHQLNPAFLTIAHDATVYPGLCAGTHEGGLGFDLRLNGAPMEMWPWLLHHAWQGGEVVPGKTHLEEWSMEEMMLTLLQQGCGERTLVCAEGHLQAVAGDPLAHTLIGRYMPDEEERPSGTHLPWSSAPSAAATVWYQLPQVHRGVALYKLIRLITLSAAGDAYMSFMGNEFAHPHRLHLTSRPHEGSSQCCWQLQEDARSPFAHIAAFDRAVMALDEREGVLALEKPHMRHVSEEHRVVCFTRGPLLFLFNFHPARCFASFSIALPRAGEYTLLLDSEAREYGGGHHTHGIHALPTVQATPTPLPPHSYVSTHALPSSASPVSASHHPHKQFKNGHAQLMGKYTAGEPQHPLHCLLSLLSKTVSYFRRLANPLSQSTPLSAKMNAPDRYERFVLPDGMKKVSYERDTKVLNAATLVIQREDHTIGNLLRMQLHRDPHVLFVGYRIPHPLKYEVQFKIQTTSQSSPQQAYNTALTALDGEMLQLKASFQEAVKQCRERPAYY
ncbi:unnamed protein product [Closterium sp. Naga37s-1]|nr:unnamed protein product [Closterium sp. Naga37s-1]